MNGERLSDREVQSLKEFCDFVEAEPISPPGTVDSRIIGRVHHDLVPSPWRLYLKFAVIEAGAGLATLWVCPQFGFTFSGHNTWLHSLHEQAGFFTYYLVCGLLFVVLGATLSALLLDYNELRTIRTSKYLYYLVFGVLACLAFFIAGAEILLVSTVPWIVGAYLGNLIGFGVIARFRMRQPIAY